MQLQGGGSMKAVLNPHGWAGAALLALLICGSGQLDQYTGTNTLLWCLAVMATVVIVGALVLFFLALDEVKSADHHIRAARQDADAALVRFRQQKRAAEMLEAAQRSNPSPPPGLRFKTIAREGVPSAQAGNIYRLKKAEQVKVQASIAAVRFLAGGPPGVNPEAPGTVWHAQWESAYHVRLLQGRPQGVHARAQASPS
jgi:hypothetical protein